MVETPVYLGDDSYGNLLVRMGNIFYQYKNIEPPAMRKIVRTLKGKRPNSAWKSLKKYSFEKKYEC